MRLIDADAVIRQIDEMRPGRCYEDAWALTVINSAPTVDAVPVVRCRECIEFVKYRSAKGGLCKNTGCCTLEDFYCADGERKGGDE